MRAHGLPVSARYPRDQLASAIPSLSDKRSIAISTGKTRATGRIDVKTYESHTYEEFDEGLNLVEIHATETFSGDIEGEGVVRFCGRSARTARRALSASSA